MKVLVAEDDPNTRKGLSQILQNEGYETFPAADGRQAIEIFDREKPEVVCLDIMMPEQDGYAVCKELRKREKPFAVDLENDGVRAAEQALFDSSYKGVTDFVTKYAWPIPAFHVVRWCAAKKISPNTVTTASLMFVLLAMYFFWQGDWALGFISAWIMTFLDTVDGKLARTTLTSSKWGNIYDHGIDLIHPPFWYFAWVKGMENTGVAIPEWMHTALLITLFGYVFGRVVEGIFMHTHGFHIHVWGKVDSFMRVYTARRNPNGFIMMIFCIFGAPVAGFAAVTAWTVICNTFHTVRLCQAGFTRKAPPLTSWMAA